MGAFRVDRNIWQSVAVPGEERLIEGGKHHVAVDHPFRHVTIYVTHVARAVSVDIRIHRGGKRVEQIDGPFSVKHRVVQSVNAVFLRQVFVEKGAVGL